MIPANCSKGYADNAYDYYQCCVSAYGDNMPNLEDAYGKDEEEKSSESENSNGEDRPENDYPDSYGNCSDKEDDCEEAAQKKYQSNTTNFLDK